MRTICAAAIFAILLALPSGACGGESSSPALNPAPCPTEEPVRGAACAGDRYCQYDIPIDPNVVCGPTYWSCISGTWVVEGSGKKCAEDGGGGGCVPGDVSSFVPAWKAPTSFHQSLCTDAQADAVVDCLNSQPDAAACKTFAADAANKACIACALTSSASAKYGPLVEGNVTVDPNVPGCIARATGDVSMNGCGAKALALGQCRQVACEVNCPVPLDDTGTALAALRACETTSEGSVCATYAAAATCADALTADGGAAAICAAAGATFTEKAKTMVKVFCGAGPADGGSGDAAEGG